MFSTDNVDGIDGPSATKKLKSSDTGTDLRVKSQNKLLFKFRDYLKTLKINLCKELLMFNKQDVPESDNAGVCN